jgi:hypothetical protein
LALIKRALSAISRAPWTMVCSCFVHLVMTRSDVDWVGYVDTHSTSGYVVILVEKLISWSSKRRLAVCHSSAETGYRVVANNITVVIWHRQLFQELHFCFRCSTMVFCDNIIVVNLSTNLVQHKHTKHVEIDLHSEFFMCLPLCSLPTFIFKESWSKLNVSNPS